MKVALFGATGMIGTRIMNEAAARGHEVTAVSRDPSKLGSTKSSVRAAAGNVLDAADVARVVRGHDAVICAVGPKPPGADPQMLVASVRSLHEGLLEAGIKRLIVVGGAGSLEVSPGKMLMDTPDFPAAWKPLATAAYEALKAYRQIRDLDWTYLSPAGFIEPGKRTGNYRVGREQLVVDEAGKSFISAEDYAVALVDEVEKPRHVRERFTVAY